MSEQDWFELEQEYRAVFRSNIPRSMLPANEELAVALVREAIRKRNDSVLDQGIPPDGAI